MTVFLILFIQAPESFVCLLGNEACVSTAAEYREECIPSSTVITVGNGSNYMRIRYTVRKVGDRCIISEEVLEDNGSGMAPFSIAGYNNSCNLSTEELEKYGTKGCQGSIVDFAVEKLSGSGGAEQGFGGGTPESDPPSIYCGMGDQQCQMKVSEYIDNCREANIEASEIVAYGDSGASYITSYIEIRHDTGCSIYYRVLNIVNLPPEIPPEVVGMEMTCTAPMEEFPREGIEREWCAGELIEYFDLLYDI